MKKEFIKGDVLDKLSCINTKYQLILTDPPYNIGWKYSSKVNDNRKDYHKWCEEWVEECVRVLDDNGVIAIINYPENNNILYGKMVDMGLHFIQQMIWHYPTNVGHSKKKYTRSYRTILVFSKGKDYTFNAEKQPYKNPTDKRIKKRIAAGIKGCNHYDLLNINLCKNTSKSKKQNGINQLPNDLVDFLIRSYTNTYDWILDPFVGNGTVTDRAYELNRNSTGIDINTY